MTKKIGWPLWDTGMPNPQGLSSEVAVDLSMFRRLQRLNRPIRESFARGIRFVPAKGSV